MSSVTMSSRSSPPSQRTWLPDGPPVTAKHPVHGFGDGPKVADDRYHPPGFRLASQGVQRLGQRVRIQGAEALVEEQRVEATATAPSEFDEA